ncbi:MAG: hypothetical protein LBK29_01960 [Oscillospiraceae bacterium]|jgi:DNA primase|nr:hypothetical protein [Oscillospiraceae bacterium]
MVFSEEFVSEVKDKNEIENVVSFYVNLVRKGRVFSGLCPFHAEKTPSFFVYPESHSFYCFGCGSGGDVITFIMLIEKFDYVESVSFLAEKAGLNLPQKTEASFSVKKKLFMKSIGKAQNFFTGNYLTLMGNLRLIIF